MLRSPLLVLAVSLGAAFVLHAAFLRAAEPSDIIAVAIYRSTESFQGDVPLSEIQFQVTDPETIRRLLSAVDFSDPRNGKRLKSKVNAFVYLKSRAGDIQAYEVYLAWQLFAHQGRRERSYPIQPGGQELFASLAR
ncbi:MAG: hypothetical protein ACRDHY_14030 [Anaerolineales bacterium]